MSAKKILSDGEIEALMDSISSGDIAVEDSSGEAKDCRLFDFNSREQALLAQLPVLKTITEKHALGLAQGVRELFRIPVEVEARESKLLKLGEAFVEVPEPAAINIVKTLPMVGVSFLVIPGDLISFLVDQYFGGSVEATNQRPANTDLTPTERRINEVLATRFLLTMQSAWSEQVSLSAEMQRTETNPDFLQLGVSDQLAVKISFGVRVFDRQSAIDWIVPYAMLEPLRSELGYSSAPGPRHTDEEWAAHMQRELPAVNVNINALFASENVSIASILGMGKGSIIPLGNVSQVTVCVEDTPFSHGSYGAYQGKKSVKITELN